MFREMISIIDPLNSTDERKFKKKDTKLKKTRGIEVRKFGIRN